MCVLWLTAIQRLTVGVLGADNKMRILFDAISITKRKAGVGVYAKNLLESLLAHKGLNFIVLAQDDDPDFDYRDRPNVTMLWVPSRFLRARPIRMIYEQTVLPFLLWKHRIDLIHSLHYSFPLFSLRSKKVVTIHDMTSYSMPEVHLAVKRFYHRFFIRAASRAADGLIFVSQSALNDFLQRFGRPKGFTAVVYHGKTEALGPCSGNADKIQQVRAKYSLPPRFVLYIGMIEPRKNLARLVEAFSRVAECQPDVVLVLAGMKGWMYEEIFARIKTLNLESRVLFPGFVAEDDKRFVLCAAELFIYPSFYEGFGLPVLEALACGVPTITSNTSSLPEVAGGAALMVEPTSTEEISHALEQLLTDVALRQQLREASIRQASLFTWQKTAAGTVRMYRGVFGGRGLANPA